MKKFTEIIIFKNKTKTRKKSVTTENIISDVMLVCLHIGITRNQRTIKNQY